MKFLSILCAAGAASAHYTFSALVVNGQTSGDWVNVRRTKNWQNNGPVENVQSQDIRCFELSPGSSGAQTANVPAGATIGFKANPNIYHPGPLAFYLAKVPAGQTAASWDGSGSVWFKIYEEQPSFGSSLSWKSNGVTSPSVKLPSCLPSGEYLFRIEHIGLHVAQSPGGAQFYISCAQINVQGGSNGNISPSTIALPGGYSASDPGIQININWPIPTSYKNPGPPVFNC